MKAPKLAVNSTAGMLAAVLLAVVLTSGCETQKPEEGTSVDQTETLGGGQQLGETDRLVLEETFGIEHTDRIANASMVDGLCDSLQDAVQATANISVSGKPEMLAALIDNKPAIEKGGKDLTASGFEKSGQYYLTYAQAVDATITEGLVSQQNRDNANSRFALVQAKGAGSTQSELGALAVVCGISLQ